MKIECENCSRVFDSEDALCPTCHWDRNADAEADMEMVPGPAFEDLESLNLGQLRPMARDLDIDRWYEMKKSELIKAISERYE